jgi:predicted nuclease of predicted toxin-antitoxin system
MRFLADESCDFRVVRALRSTGHDVAAVADMARGASDETVIDLALREGRIFLTEDSDFGQLVYAAGRPSAGVIFLRFPATARAALSAAVLDLVATHGEKLFRRFVVLQPGRVRIGGSPEG